MSELDRRRVLGLLAALGAAGLTAACGGDEEPSDAPSPAGGGTLRIGMLVPQTGGFKPIGDEIINGFQLYLTLHGGRLGGHHIDLVIEDEGDTDQAGRAGLDRLLGRGVAALTGVVNSTVMLAIRDGVRQAKIPLVGSNASPENLQGEVYIWRTSFVNGDAGRAIGPFVSSKARGKVAMIAPDYPAGQDVINGFRDGFGRADSRLIAEPVWTGTASNPGRDYYKEQLERLNALRPNAVFAFFAGAAAVEFVRQYRAAGLEATLYGPGFLTEGPALTELGADAQDIFTSLNYSADLPNGANRVFSSAYRRAHNVSPTTYAMASYDAAQVLDKAIQLAGDRPTPQQINLMLGRVGQVTSPRGSWQFNQSRTPQQKWYLRQVRPDGQVLANVLIRELNTLG